jgi:hypothetical protein
MNEIQIISATIEVNAATPTWSPQQGVIFYTGAMTYQQLLCCCRSY